MVGADDRGVGGEQQQAGSGQNHSEFEAQAADDHAQFRYESLAFGRLEVLGQKANGERGEDRRSDDHGDYHRRHGPASSAPQGKFHGWTQLADAFQTGKCQPSRRKSDQQLIVRDFFAGA